MILMFSVGFRRETSLVSNNRKQWERQGKRQEKYNRIHINGAVLQLKSLILERYKNIHTWNGQFSIFELFSPHIHMHIDEALLSGLCHNFLRKDTFLRFLSKETIKIINNISFILYFDAFIWIFLEKIIKSPFFKTIRPYLKKRGIFV